MLTFGSVCSGIEAASVAWEPLGWRAVWFAEVDKAASEVLAHRFPHVPNLGDMTLLADKVRGREIAAPDVLVGGTPCQAFSLAGRRQGLADERGALTLAFVELANAIDEVRFADCLPPCIIVWENVPGVLSSKDNAFGCFIAGLAGEQEPIEPGPKPEYGRATAHWAWEKATRVHRPKWTNAGCAIGTERAIAWCTRDAQYFGLAQRRRRVFVVAGAGAGFDPGAILLEFQGVRRDSAPRRSAGEGFTHATAPCLVSSGRGVERTGDTRGQDPVVAVIRGSAGLTELAPYCMAHGQGGAEIRFDGLAPTLTCNHEAPIAFTTKDHGGDATADLSPTLRSMGHDRSHPNGGGQIGVAYAFQPRIARNGRGDMGDIVNALTAQAGETGKGDAAPCVAYAIQERAGADLNSGPGGKGFREDDCAYTLEARHHAQSVAYAVLPFDTTQATSPGNYSKPDYGDPCHPLTASAHPPAICVTGDITHTLKAEGFDASEDGTGRGQPIVPVEAYRVPGNVAPYSTGDRIDALTSANDSSAQHVIRTEMAVRRLMPVECERLQGFPDNWTLVPTGSKAKPAADGPRYKQCGNSMAVNVMRWIGARIDSWATQHASPIGHNSIDFDEVLG